MVFAFFTPSVVEQYAQEAVRFEPTSLSIDSFSATGVRARVQGDFLMDASKVEKKSVRDLGRFGTWIAREAESGESKVEVSLPEYGNVVLGTAVIPPIKVDLRDGYTTHVDFVADLAPGDIDGVRRIASDWIDGRLGHLRVLGKANVPIKSGIFSLGTQTVSHELVFANEDIPTMPAYKIQRLNFREVDIPTGKGMAADVSLKVENPYPVEFTIPPLGFGILVDNCLPTDPYIMLADALTDSIDIAPKTDIALNVTGTVRQLPDVLTQACPGSNDSPLDQILGNYINGEETKIYVQGSDSPSLDTPQWITDILSSMTVPVSIPGHSFGHLIRNFSMVDAHFGLPSPLADPGTPEAQPRISATVRALVALPEEMNFNISVGRVRADAKVYYKGNELGTLDLHKWQSANSTRVPAEGEDEGPSLMVESAIKDVPLSITNEDVLSDVISALLFGSKSVIATVKANVDVGVETALGDFAVRNIPAEGEVPIKRRS